ncbi:unnamed protein product [Mycena citricolor]|uniref:Tc1-like transposase DDE domain-containing protein n=1 Tax=Mycena citricolor TaxID=2018698 RepID=A0AAD2K2A1_9AGAR|nr:unnamed protein product [Mycena citricolor]
MKELIVNCRAMGHDLPDPDAWLPGGRKLRGECPSFNCQHKPTTACCMKKILYCKPDFQAQLGMLKEHCMKRGYKVIFFSKYHPELNFIEQCWGYAKCIYRIYPRTTNKESLKRTSSRLLNLFPLSPCIASLSDPCALLMDIITDSMGRSCLG